MSSLSPSPTTWTIVVFDGNPLHDWNALFSKQTVPSGVTLDIVQTSWIDAVVTNYHGAGGCTMLIAPTLPTTLNKVVKPSYLTVRPDFVIMRNQPRGPTPGSDRRNVLFGLMTARVPSINTLSSEYMNLERPIMYGALAEIEARVGHDRFPLLPQNFYSHPAQMIIAPPFPAIAKVSHAHAGMGKFKLANNDAFRDLSTVLALNQDYCTVEQFVTAQYGIRVQKIGNSYCVMKKHFTGAGWKSQFGGSHLEVVELEEKYKLWADEAATSFGGMDILAIDALHADGKDWIIEMNGTAIGVLEERWVQDSSVICQLALERMTTIQAEKATKASSPKVGSDTTSGASASTPSAPTESPPLGVEESTPAGVSFFDRLKHTFL
jgi:hypothetical protein